MSDVTDILNRSSPLDADARMRINHFDSNIQRRQEGLDFALQLRDEHITELPVYAYSLHIQFCGLRIVLHRMLSKNASQTAPDSGTEASHSPPTESEELSRTIMYENAKRIAKLVWSYQQIFGIESVITVMLDNMFVAATVLISHLLHSPLDDSSLPTKRDLHLLRNLADLLLKAQKHYPVTVRMRSTLSSIVEGTGLAGTFGTFASTVGTPTNALGGADRTDGLPPHDLGTPGDFFSDSDDRLFQDMNMDLSNNLSWLLSPTNEEVDPLFQV